LNVGSIDPITAAGAASRIFADLGDVERTRWLELELNGYGSFVTASPLHTVLGVRENDRLAFHVAAYRTQTGLVPEQSTSFRHFFIESLQQLMIARAEVARSHAGASVRLEFASDVRAPLHPTAGVFSADVFHRVVSGFVAALHLQLGVVAR
jgi:hypothetical protein